jgi:hypothetical protein
MSLRARGTVGRSGGAGVDVLGLTAWVTALKGPEFRDVNRALREEAYAIALDLEPEVTKAVEQSRAHQAKAVALTVRAKRDRVPVVVVGKVNPKFRSKQGRQPAFTRRGKGADQHRKRRGAIAHGVVYGPKGGHLKADGSKGRARGANFYGIPRNESGGPVGRYLQDGPAFNAATTAYFEAYQRELRKAGIVMRKGRPVVTSTIMSRAA